MKTLIKKYQTPDGSLPVRKPLVAIPKLPAPKAEAVVQNPKGLDIKKVPDDQNPAKENEKKDRNLGQKFSQFGQSPLGQSVLGAADAAANGISAIGQMNSKVDVLPEQQMAKDMLTNIASKFGPWGQAAAAAYKIVDAVGNMTGTNLDGLSKDQTDAAGISGIARFANNAAGVLAPLAGLFTGDTIDAYNSKDVQELSNAFGGTAMDIDTANTMGGKSYLFGKRKANKFIESMNNNVDTLTTLNRTNSIRKNSAYGTDLAQQNLNLYNGASAADRTYVGKEGLKLISANEAKSMLERKEFREALIKSFQNGGVIGVDTNILPEGALHKDLNHLEDVNPEVGEEVTTKGIPVVVTDSEGNIEQVAEIEKEEIILRKELTDKIEELWKDGSEEAMIEAGKLLAEEIITNTQDNTGQLENGNSNNNN